jgi:hypothetical protein
MNEHSGSLNSIQWTFALVILQETLAAFPIQVPHLVPGAHGMIHMSPAAIAKEFRGHSLVPNG